MSKDDVKQNQVTLKRHIGLSLRMLKTGWEIRSKAMSVFFLGAFLEIGAFVTSIYATARLGALLAGFIANGQTTGIWFWLWIDIVAAAVMAIGFFTMTYAKHLLYYAFVHWSTNTFMRTLCELDLQEYYSERTRNKINKVGAAYTWQLSNLSSACLDLLYALLRFIAITIIVAQITWWLVPLIAVFLIPTLMAEGRLAKLQWFVWDAKGDQRHIFWGLDHILRQAKGQMELRSSQATQYVLRKIDSMNNDFYREQEHKYRLASRLVVPTKILEVMGTGAGSIILLRQLLGRTISLDRYFFLSGALLRIGGALNNIFGTLSRMQETLLFADSYFDLIDSKPHIVDTPGAIKLPNNSTPDILFKNVSFSYPEQNSAIFENLNLHIRPGEHVALVGENGAGKSTLIKLLLRLYRPTKGQILINGIDLNALSIDSWYSLLATLFQDFNHYPMPIDENIYIGRSSQKPDQKLLTQAAKFGGVDELVKSYEHGWNTVLDSSFKKGIEPSGGQWQRVALARAFYRQANVLILDEPTAAIDAKAEYDIFNNIFEHYRGKTTIIVSHRFSTVRRADRIIVVDHGKIVETGSHSQLLKKKGLYHEMFSKQAEGYR
ncbi:MAG: ABC transporter ATP-binding protein [Patescibacteria group bacterium]